MEAETIAAWLAAGEGEHTEFKEKYSSRVIESLVAFANTAGGRVLIGVNDRGRIVCGQGCRERVERVPRSGQPAVDADGGDSMPHCSGHRQATGKHAGRGAGRGYRTDACQKRRRAGRFGAWPPDAAGVRRGNPHPDVA
jgi:hypothetical protein